MIHALPSTCSFPLYGGLRLCFWLWLLKPCDNIFSRGSHMWTHPELLLSSLNQSSFKMDWGNCSAVQLITFKIVFWEAVVTMPLYTKKGGTIKPAISTLFKSLPQWWYKGALVPMDWTAYTSGKAKICTCSHLHIFCAIILEELKRTIIIMLRKCLQNENNSVCHCYEF